MNGPASILAGLFFIEQAACHAQVNQERPGTATADKEVLTAAFHAFQGLAGQGGCKTVCRRILDEPGQAYFNGRNGLSPDTLVEEGPYRFYFR